MWDRVAILMTHSHSSAVCGTGRSDALIPTFFLPRTRSSKGGLRDHWEQQETHIRGFRAVCVEATTLSDLVHKHARGRSKTLLFQVWHRCGPLPIQTWTHMPSLLTAA